ncbi:MAG: hypothetical protein AB1814_13320 [Thermodesulfobacteriota bacterium]
MKKWLTVSLVAALVLGGGWLVLNGAGLHMSAAWARGWGGGCPMRYQQGTPGGGDYTPQRGFNRGQGYGLQGQLSSERARDIVVNHLRQTNPAFAVGQGRDAGTHYVFDITSSGQTVDRLAVDKNSGMVSSVN